MLDDPRDALVAQSVSTPGHLHLHAAPALVAGGRLLDIHSITGGRVKDGNVIAIDEPQGTWLEQ